jgi:adducin
LQLFFHLQARVNSEDEHYLVAPTGVSFSDITASGLVKVDAHGSVVDAGPEAPLAPNRSLFTLLGLLHAARPDLKCAMFLCSPSVVSVSE